MNTQTSPFWPAFRTGLRATARFEMILALLVLGLCLLLTLTRPAQAMKIETIKTPKGIEAWLVRDTMVPLVAMRFSFDGGNAQEDNGKEGLANFMSSLLDEGAGELNAQAFQEKMEELAVRLGFDDGRDHMYGSFETLTANRAEAVKLLKLALTAPRFDADAVERIRRQILSGLAFDAKDPDRVAGEVWSKRAFPGHVYGRPSKGTPESVRAITREDIQAFHRRLFARDTLKVVAVGDIDAATLSALIDDAFGDLPATAKLSPIPPVTPVTQAAPHVVEMDFPQSVAVFGRAGIARKDPDFIPAFVLNHILGGGGFSSRLMTEVREKRGLAYSVYSYLQTYQHAAIVAGGVATKNEEIGRSLDVIRAELNLIATEGPTETELANAKSYLVGSYALRFDTNSKIASQLMAIMQEGLGVDYVDRRNSEVEAVTLADVRRAAKRLLDGELLVTVVGKPQGLTGAAGTGAAGTTAKPAASKP